MTMSNIQAPKGLVGALAAVAEKETPKPADQVYEGYAYAVTLRNGLQVRRLSRDEPEKLWRVWSQARKQDDLLVWADDAATEARQIVDLEIDAGDPGSTESSTTVPGVELGEPRD